VKTKAVIKILLRLTYFGPGDTALGRTEQETPLSTNPLLLHVVTVGADPQRTPFPAVLPLVTVRDVFHCRVTVNCAIT
jgi:hypothetical protein